MNNENIVPIWQPVGCSTHLIARKVSEKLGVATSHTGTLDPMAEGVVIVLAGEDRLKKYEYAKWQKTYEFNICFGVSTDSYDGLGFVTGESNLEVKGIDLSLVLSSFVGNYKQQVPPYSAIKVKGKPMHWYARNNDMNQVVIPERSGVIYDIKLQSLKKLSFNEVITNTLNKISLVEGDLRQLEVTEAWKHYISKLPSNREVSVAGIEVTMSKGLYVRSLAMDICKNLNTLGFVSSLIRTKNGIYTKSNSLPLSDFV